MQRAAIAIFCLGILLLLGISGCRKRLDRGIVGRVAQAAVGRKAGRYRPACISGKMSARVAQRAYRDFEKDRTNSVWAEIDLPDAAFELCIELARRHVSRLGARTLDTLHVAAALELGADHFWTFDERQAKLAKAGGLELT